MNHWLIRAILLPPLAVLLYAAWLPWRAEQHARALESGEIPLLEAQDWAWVAGPSLTAARLKMLRGGYPSAQVRSHLDHALTWRPLYAPAWLDLAELEWREGNTERALTLAHQALALWPTRRRHLYQLAQFFLKLGEIDAALGVYATYLQAEPTRAPSVLTLLLKLGVQPNQIAVSLSAGLGQSPDKHRPLAEGVMKFSTRIGNLALAEAWWTRLPESLKPEQAVVQPYLDLALAVGDVDRVCQIWKLLYPDEGCANALRNGDFSSPAKDFGLGWRVISGDGFEVDFADSLELRFDGTENSNFSHVRQWVPLNKPGSYRLVAEWQGERLTTRSGVYLEIQVACPDGGRTARSQARYGSWERESVEVGFEVSPGCAMGEVRVRRNATDALDRYIEGTLSLDNVRILRSGTFE